MANNRLFLVYRPTGDAVCIGCRLGWGWMVTSNIEERLNTLFKVVENIPLEANKATQDDYILVIEDAEKSPCLTDNWKYEENKNTILEKIKINNPKNLEKDNKNGNSV